MASQLYLSVPASPAIPLLGDREVLGGCVVLPLTALRERMAPRRDVLAKRYSSPPDPATLPAWYSEIRRRERLQYLAGRHREHMDLVAAIAELDVAIDRGADLERTAVLRSRGRTTIEFWGGFAILDGDFAWAECRACAKRYAASECRLTEWKRLADPLAGFGGGWLSCPSDHLVFTRQTWIA